ncbi:MAG: glycogen debranching protein GlgX [Gammaproteobacteria bacterium]|nr:glycogen debranching protein GlgX [Gammaproteobacteria bacterium]
MTGKHLMVPGDYHTLGANWDGEGVNFALFSAHAEEVELCLFEPGGKQEIARHSLPRQTNDIWHGYLPGLAPGAVYGYRVHGPYEPLAGHRFNHHKLLVDPYAKQLRGNFQWSDHHFGYRTDDAQADLSLDTRDNADFLPKGVVTAPLTHRQIQKTSSRKPFIPWDETILYETHLRGFTIRHPEVPELQQGTFAGFSHRKIIEYIKALGVTSIELLPVQSFIDEHSLHQHGLENYWGYNTLNFFSAHSAYHGGDGVSEFRSMVDAYHDAGLEIILDVVYNHTCEGNHLGPTLSFRGIDNASYYHLQAEQPRYYVNDTGCGNTVNVQHPMVLRMIMDSLRYWTGDMGVDGFRFDLAATLGRGKSGFSSRASLFQAMGQDPQLARSKLIAEPWDIGPGGYQLGKFPAGWAEWNDSYRDTVRRFWRKEPGVQPTFARRLHGSSDIFEHSGRRPFATVNYITSHDGFTLHDLVSYNQRHNHDNGEDNRDGHGENLSYNFGVEGETDNVEILALRRRQKRNMLATLLVSQGVPMIQAGDELGRTQQGNNNAYCQNNEISWIDWSVLSQESEQPDLRQDVRFVTRLLELRKSHPVLSHFDYIHPPHSTSGVKLEWLNSDSGEMRQEHWLEHHNFFVGYLLSKATDGPDQGSVLVIFNNNLQEQHFRLPGLSDEQSWHWLADTSQIYGGPLTPMVAGGDTAIIAERSVAIFSSKHLQQLSVASDQASDAKPNLSFEQ